ncbi:hypothetical protein BS47DRAFT_1368436 [Hydnum rufescens UP504]|uniref:Uncharacterized protein n=1 Tax=Hydnum rufescens UP504 TaxID=1448309 RepID=A0A9P6AFJ5_9AGAM|nr:hypothetical protein BS47DRAFT_1368436 [Hydnum rufescens UP504]
MAIEDPQKRTRVQWSTVAMDTGCIQTQGLKRRPEDNPSSSRQPQFLAMVLTDSGLAQSTRVVSHMALPQKEYHFDKFSWPERIDGFDIKFDINHCQQPEDEGLLKYSVQPPWLCIMCN